MKGARIGIIFYLTVVAVAAAPPDKDRFAPDIFLVTIDALRADRPGPRCLSKTDIIPAPSWVQSSSIATRLLRGSIKGSISMTTFLYTHKAQWRNVERRGMEVVEHTEAWLKVNPTGPHFAWIQPLRCPRSL